jgi:NADH:ubiquinone oxidoreductase subunit 5 (subunit L)/multisubunit Na+/H+ antiporter MnhA subunit
MDPIFNLVPFAILIPLVGLLVNLLFGRRLGQPAAGIIASVATGLSFAVAVALAVALMRNSEDCSSRPYRRMDFSGQLQRLIGACG